MSVECLEGILQTSELWAAIGDAVVVVSKVFGAAQMLKAREAENSL